MDNQNRPTPRRYRLDLITPAEKAIVNAVDEIEKAGCDPLLTDAINLLHAAREKVADFVEGSMNSERNIPFGKSDEDEFNKRKNRIDTNDQ